MTVGDTTTQPGPEAVQTALDALHRLALVHDRPELAEACDAAVRRLTGNRFRIVVAGEFKRGKSSLINALLDADVCAVDDDIATAARLEITYHDTPIAKRWSRATTPDAPDGAAADEIVVTDLPIGEAAAASTLESTTLVRAAIPRRLLRGGLVLIDTPGVGGMSSAASVATASTMNDAHAVLFVTDASQELTRPERDALADAAERCRLVYLVETKIDMYPQWRDIVRADRKHIDDLGLATTIEILPVSSVLRRRAVRHDDGELNAEAGFPDLVRLVGVDLPAAARGIAIDGAMHTARRVYHHLRLPLAREVDLLDRGTDTDDVRARVADAKAEVAAFKERVAGWQQILSDGATDLAAAVDVDLRDRIRAIVAAAEETLDDVDPDDVWHEFEPTLYRDTAEALDANLNLLRDRAEDLATRLADAIADDEAGLLAFDDLDDELALGDARRHEGDTGSAGARAQQAFRAGYGGAMPIMAVGGMALGVLGLGTLVLPLAAVAGVMAGRKALTDERERRLNQRRQQAKVAVKKYADEAMLRAAAERKQAQRRVQRALRDHFGGRVKELAATRQRAVERADEVARTSDEQRRQRLAAARDELARIEQVARTLAGGA